MGTKIIACASQKGGSGKSTITIHLATSAAAEGMSVLIADLDPHSQTAIEWGKIRETNNPLVVRATKADLDPLLEQARKKKFDLVFLDLPPYVNEIVENATRMATLTLVPTHATFPDVKTLGKVVSRIHPPFFIVLNDCEPGIRPFENRRTKEIRTLLKYQNWSAAPVSLTHRVSFYDAMTSGQSVGEYEPKSPAAREAGKLWKWLKGELNNG